MTDFMEKMIKKDFKNRREGDSLGNIWEISVPDKGNRKTGTFFLGLRETKNSM